MKKYLGSLLLLIIFSCTNNQTITPIPTANNHTPIPSDSVNEEPTYNKYIYDINSEYLLEKTNNINQCSIFSFKDIFFSQEGNGVVLNQTVNLYFDKDYNITNIKDYGKEFQKSDIRSYGITQYRLDANLNGYLLSKNIQPPNSLPFSKITEIKNGEISNSILLLDEENFSLITADKLFIDTDISRFYLSSYNTQQKLLKLYFFENLKLVKEEILELNVPLTTNEIADPKFFMNDKKEGLLLYEKQLSAILNEDNSTHIFFKKISDFKISESFNITANFIMTVLGLSFDSDGNGIIFYKDSKNNIYSKEIINYRPEKFDNLETSMIDNTSKDNKTLFSFSFDKNGSGIIAWLDKENNIYNKSVNNFNISGDIKKISTDNKYKLNLNSKINQKGEALVVWNEPNPYWEKPHNLTYTVSSIKDYCNELFIKKISY